MTDLRTRLAALPAAERAELERRLLAGRADRRSLVGIPRRRPDDPTPLSFAQQRLWLITQLDPDDPAYNVYRIMRVRGRLDLPAFRQAVGDVVMRHETLRTTFAADLGKPRQEIDADGRPAISVIDLGGRSDADVAAVRLAEREVHAPFDLTRGPLVKLLVCRIADDDHLVALTMHHIVADEWSLRLFNGEVSRCYAARCAGASPELPPLPIQYADFALWERRRVETGALDAQRDFWGRTLRGAPDLPNLSTAGPRPPARRAEGRKLRWLLPRPLTADLDRLAQTLAVTPFMLMLAAFQAWLHRRTGQSDIVVGTPIAGRPRAELRDLIGFFANTLALRSHGAEDRTFRAFVGGTKDALLAGVSNQDLPFEEVVKAVNPNRTLGRAPLFRVLFTHRDEIGPALAHPALDVSAVTLERDTAKCDLWLSLVDGRDGRAATFEYDTMLFEPAEIERMAAQFEDVLRAVVADPERRFSTLPPVQTTGPSPAQPVADRLLADAADAAGPPSPPSGPAGIVLARNAVEVQLVRIWHALLGRTDVGVTDNFFAVGGHSLMAVEVMAKIKEIFGKTLPLHVLWYGEGTVEALARELCRDHDGTLWSRPIPIRADGDRRAVFCVHIAGGILSDYAELCRHLDPGQPIYGLQAVGIDGAMPPHTSVGDIARHCIESMRTIQPAGPHRLLGYCSGGVFAYEMARQLSALGEAPEFLGLIDTAAPGYRRRPLIDRLGRRLRRLPTRAAMLARHVLTPDVETGHGVGHGIRHAHLVALSSYTIEAYPGAVHLFRSGLWPDGAHPTTGWQAMVSGTLSLHDLPCDHDQIVREPAVRLLADRISGVLVDRI